MVEKRSEPLVPMTAFFMRLARGVVFGLFIIAVALFIGMIGYHAFEKMSWIDAFVNAAMILSGMGPLSPLTTTGGKLFAGFYALFSGLAFILIVGMMFAPIVHRFFHKFHFDSDGNSKRRK
jgi:hypothetical protein